MATTYYPFNSGKSLCSTEAKNASISMWIIRFLKEGFSCIVVKLQCFELKMYQIKL